MTTISAQSNISFNTYTPAINSTNLSTKLNNNENVEETPENLMPIQLNEKKQLSNQEVAAIYFNRQASLLTKDLITIYADAKKETTLRDINEFHRKNNRSEFIQNADKNTIDNSELLDILKSEKKIDSKEAIAIYVNHQNNNSIQNKIDIYSSVESQNESSDDINYQDINDLYKQNNRSEFMQNVNSSKEPLYF